IRIHDHTIDMFRTVKMNVRKWRTNRRDLDREWTPDSSSKVKVLGHLWDTESDTLSLSVDLLPHIRPRMITKRIFSSLLARIYDPMGIVLPYVVHLRLFLAKLWSHSLDWDDPVPD